MNTAVPNGLGRTVRGFFGDYLPTLRGLSRHTLLSYRDTLTLLLRFLAMSGHVDPVALDLEAISPDAVLEFLNYLEQERHNKISSRNVRLAAIHAFFRYVSFHTPERIEQAQRILGIPFKRTGSRPIDYLEYEEIDAVLGSVDRIVRDGHRDYALLALLFNTGARAQEIVDLAADDLQLESPHQVKLYGKGRKTRICPLWPQTAQVLKEFVVEIGLDLHSHAPVFCNQRGERLTRFGIRYILAKYCKIATATCPSLASKRLHPHSMRHYFFWQTMSSGCAKTLKFTANTLISLDIVLAPSHPRSFGTGASHEISARHTDRSIRRARGSIREVPSSVRDVFETAGI
jgi:integrase/recombinase XerD